MAIFSTWAALRTAILDALADSLSGEPCVGEFTKGERTLKYRSYKELTDLYERTQMLEASEGDGDPATTISYGRHRRFN